MHGGHALTLMPAARARQATKMLNEEVAGLVSGLRSTSGSSLAAFGRMEERVLAMEAEAEASSQLGGVRAPARARVMTHSLLQSLVAIVAIWTKKARQRLAAPRAQVSRLAQGGWSAQRGRSTGVVTRAGGQQRLVGGSLRAAGGLLRGR